MARLKYRDATSGQWMPITGSIGPAGATGSIGPQPVFGTPSASTVAPTPQNTLGTATVSISGSGTAGSPYIMLVGVPGGIKGDKGDKGDTGMNGAVQVTSAQPTDPLINLWVEPDDDLGDSGWVALDARYINTLGDTMTGPVVFSGTVQANSTVQANNGGMALELKPGSANHTYMGLFSSTAAPTTRSGYIGYPSNGATTLTIDNELANAGISLVTNGTGRVLLSADPTAALHAATKQYVDAKPATATVASTAPASPVTGQIWCPI